MVAYWQGAGDLCAAYGLAPNRRLVRALWHALGALDDGMKLELATAGGLKTACDGIAKGFQGARRAVGLFWARAASSLEPRLAEFVGGRAAGDGLALDRRHF